MSGENIFLNMGIFFLLMNKMIVFIDLHKEMGIIMRYYYDSTSNDAALLLSQKLRYIIKASKTSEQETIILCVGSDRSTGDSLGPIVGYKLKKNASCNFYVYGDLNHPVHAANLLKYMECIRQSFTNPYIIAIDASLGRKDHVGLITLGAGPLRPGLGVKKKLPEVGEIHITGIVNESSDENHSTLQTTRLCIIMQIADVISNAFCLLQSDNV